MRRLVLRACGLMMVGFLFIFVIAEGEVGFMNKQMVASELVKIAKGLVGKEIKMSDLGREEQELIKEGVLGWGLIALSDLWAEGITVSKDGKENPVLEKKAEKILENHYQRAKDKGVVFVRKER